MLGPEIACFTVIEKFEADPWASTACAADDEERAP